MLLLIDRLPGDGVRAYCYSGVSCSGLQSSSFDGSLQTSNRCVLVKYQHCLPVECLVL